ncbi:MAG: DUF1292 domain-containing protein [Saccharofermentans sp.]|nr:DUF1292 domain-containing protein [Saccharofermentans sp.]
MEDTPEYGQELFTLVDEEGNESEFELLDAMEIDGQKYLALVPYVENLEDLNADNEDLVILKVEVNDGEEILAVIEDDDEYDKVGNMFLTRLQEFIDEDIKE